MGAQKRWLLSNERKRSKKNEIVRRIHKNNEKENAILTFLRETKEGKYAPIEESSLEYVRMEDEQDNIEIPEENFYYSIG
jgi:hypothetical protein